MKLFLVLKPGEHATAEEMLAYCANVPTKYKWPTELEFRDELPKNNIGKVLKKDLRAEEAKKRVSNAGCRGDDASTSSQRTA